MKRSEVNGYIMEANAYFQEQRFALPPFAEWTPEGWKTRGTEAEEIRERRLGWDVTDFGSGKFEEVGLLAFTLRNGSNAAIHKPYAEKIIYLRQNQLVPFHYHALKTEDLINRGGLGSIVVRLYNAKADGGFAETPVFVSCDGILKTFPAGASVELKRGESITLTPNLYHAFHAAGGPALIGEVSSLNDDDSDNRFYAPLPRYSEIQENESPLRLLCTEYPRI